MNATAARILLVDDDVSLTHLVSHVLEQYGGYDVAVENQSEDALATARKFGPDLILLDRQMPRMSGDEIFSAIRESDRNVPIAFFSGDNTEVEAAGERTWRVPKPIGMMALLSTVQAILS